MPSSFTLSKWYLDCVADDGDALVAYAARLRWGPVRLSYASALRRRAGSTQATVESSLREAPLPERTGSDVTWSAPLLGIEGAWKGLSPPLAASILEAPEGSVAWRCWLPRSRASVAHGSERIEGLGYVEELALTLPPWRLPIDELWWGRFLGERHALVWIDWRGPHSRRLAWLDDRPLPGACVDTERVEDAGAGVRLSIEPGGLLRQGALGRTALAVLPAVDRLLPVRILATDETKWCARGSLDVRGEPADHGWVIHEVVRWPAR
jgi:hypothetical protein